MRRERLASWGRPGEAGHDVHGVTRNELKQAPLRERGAVPVVADALDRQQVAQAVARATPDVIVHELTSIGALGVRHFDRSITLTNRVRTEATDHVLPAGQSVGCAGSSRKATSLPSTARLVARC